MRVSQLFDDLILVEVRICGENGELVHLRIMHREQDMLIALDSERSSLTNQAIRPFVKGVPPLAVLLLVNVIDIPLTPGGATVELQLIFDGLLNNFFRHNYKSSGRGFGVLGFWGFGV